jgi:hypothetical protein
MTWYAGDNSTNNGSFGWLFEAPGGVSVDVPVTGVEATGAVGSVAVVIPDVVVPVTGVTATGQVGGVTIEANAVALTAGLSASSAVGAVQVVAEAVVSILGVSASAVVGAVDVTADANIPQTGLSATGSVGAVLVSANANIAPTGVSATTFLNGDGLVIRSPFRIPVTGVQGTLQSPDVQPNITEILSGVFGQGFGNGVTVKVLQPISTPQLTGAVSQVQANTKTTLTTPTLTLIIGDVTRTAEVFNFETVKETYSRQRTIILPRVA